MSVAMSNPFEFLHLFMFAVGDHILTLAAGCVVTILIGLIEKYVVKRQVSWKADIAILLVFLFFACFQAWRDEHRKAINTQAEIERLAKPILTGSIGEVTFGPAGEHNENLIAIIEAKIVNAGAPSALDNIASVVQLKTGRVVQLIPLDPPKVGITAKGLNGTSMFFQISDYLPRAGLKPIPTGGILTGFLFGLLRDMTPQDTEFPMTVGHGN